MAIITASTALMTEKLPLIAQAQATSRESSRSTTFNPAANGNPIRYPGGARKIIASSTRPHSGNRNASAAICPTSKGYAVSNTTSNPSPRRSDQRGMVRLPKPEKSRILKKTTATAITGFPSNRIKR